jgi:predicted Zn-dependent protease
MLGDRSTKVCAICALLAAWLSISDLPAHRDLDIQIADLTQRIAADPDNPQLYMQRGELHRLHRDWKAAEADYRRVRKLQPSLAVFDFLMGRMKLEARRPKQARKLLDRFLAEEPDHAKGLVARARALVRLGEPLAAARDYTRAIDAHGEEHRPDPSYYVERARALVSAGDEHIAAAVRGLDEGLERLGQPVTLQLYAIDLELKRGRHDAALERLSRIASQADRQETWLVRRAEILEDAGRPAEARDAYAAALEAVRALPPSRQGTRAVLRLQARAEAALERLDAAPSHDSPEAGP